MLFRSAISRIIEGKTLCGDIPTLIDVKFIMIALQKQYNKNSPYTEYEKIVKEAQSYKSDAERYKIIRNIYTKNSDSWTKQEKAVYRIISTEDTNNRRFDEAIDEAMKESK